MWLVGRTWGTSLAGPFDLVPLVGAGVSCGAEVSCGAGVSCGAPGGNEAVSIGRVAADGGGPGWWGSICGC